MAYNGQITDHDPNEKQMIIALSWYIHQKDTWSSDMEKMDLLSYYAPNGVKYSRIL